MLEHLLERSPAERAVDVLDLEEFRGERRLEHAAVIGEPGEIGAAIVVADLGTKTGLREQIRQIERDRARLEDRRGRHGRAPAPCRADADCRYRAAPLPSPRRMSTTFSSKGAPISSSSHKRAERSRAGCVIEREHESEPRRTARPCQARAAGREPGARSRGSVRRAPRRRARRLRPAAAAPRAPGLQRGPEFGLQRHARAVSGDGERSLLHLSGRRLAISDGSYPRAGRSGRIPRPSPARS